jgi:hypothetical protein
LLAQGAGGIQVVQDGKAYLINCMISSNTANPSFSPLSTAALKVESGRVWLGNGTRFANNSFKVEAAEVIYVLPAPPGHYTNARKCEVVYTSCPDGCSNNCTQNRSLKAASTAINCTQPPYNIQSCPWNMGLAANSFGEEILGLLLEKLLPGVYDWPEWPVPCSPGLLGATADNTNLQTTPLCAGLCPAGFYCPAYATTEQIPCTQGNYCPKGASAPLPCAKGSYSNATNLTSDNECVDTDAGHFAPTGSTEQTPCSAGTVQPQRQQPKCDNCAAGKFMNASGQTECHACAPGSYCPEGASAPLPCSEGTYSNMTDLGAAADCTGTDRLMAPAYTD